MTPRSHRRPRASSEAESLRLRRATPRDLPMLVRHRHRMWREIGRWSEPELARADLAYRRWVRRETAGRRFFAFLVEDRGGTIAGSGAVWLAPSQPRPGHLAGSFLPYILSMYTEPQFRQRGVATRLVETMVAWAARRGYRRITLHASEKGRPVYARLGFEPSREMRLDLPRRRRR